MKIDFQNKKILKGKEFVPFEFKISEKLNLLPKHKLGELKELQGNLKDLSEDNAHKLLLSINEFGFAFPFFGWESGKEILIIDGHQRQRTLEKMLGSDIEVPVLLIDAKNKKEAKKLLLALNSQYGKVTKDGFDEFAFDLETDFVADFTTFDNWLDFEAEFVEADTEEQKYTQKIQSPIYEPKYEKPQITQLYDIEKTNELIAEIQNSSCDKEIKQFLILAAQRHIVFNYENIADFYAHSDKETQNLMENSALVIIDINKAIEHGYVKLNEEIKEQYLTDYPDEDE